MSKKQIIQCHHILYGNKPEEEWTVRVTKAEHWIITQLQRHKSLSSGAVRAILHLLATKPEREIE